MKTFTILALALAMVSCLGQKNEIPSPEPPPPIVLDARVEFTVFQRSTNPLPGSKGKIVLTLDDITRGQVMTTLAWHNGPEIVATRSLCENNVVTFTADNRTYRIKLKKLTNLLVGNDSATFLLWPATTELDLFLSETEKIEILIDSLKQLVGATFIRNGQEHTLNDTIAHMRVKWEWKKSEIKTADDFIRIAGSCSSTSGTPYIIRMFDGTGVKTGDWFREQLQLIEKFPYKNHEQ